MISGFVIFMTLTRCRSAGEFGLPRSEPGPGVAVVDLKPEAAAATSENIQNALYGGLIMPFAVLAGMTYVAKRNVHHDDDAPTDKPGKE